MTWSNARPDVALIHIMERDLVIIGQALEYDVPTLEQLVLHAAQSGLLDEATAGKCGQAIGHLHDALTALKKWLAFLRDSRPQEVIIVEMAQEHQPADTEDMALLVELPIKDADGATVLNKLFRGFKQLHGTTPTRIAVASRAKLPQSLARAALGKLRVEEDTSIQPGRARLLA